MGKQIALNTALYGYNAFVTDSIPESVDKAAEWAKGYMEVLSATAFSVLLVARSCSW